VRSLLRRTGLALVACLVLLGTASTSRALTLADLVGGGSFMAESAPLLFDNFEVTIGGALSGDLGDYVVDPLADGFAIIAPIGVVNGFGDILIEYDVWVKQGPGINGASVFFNGAAFGAGSLASVSEDFLAGDPDPIADLLVFATGVGLVDKYDETTFDGSYLHLHVIKDIIVVGGTYLPNGFDLARIPQLLRTSALNVCEIGCPAPTPGIATISLIEERFRVPEPLTGSLVGVGLLGLWHLGGRPRRARAA
jgi:hypothetical protein